jgi:hypothetical protein
MAGFFRRRTHYDNDNHVSYENYNDDSDVDNSSNRISSKKNRRQFWIFSLFLVFFSLTIAFRKLIPTKTSTYKTSHSHANLVVSTNKIWKSSQSDACWHIPIPSFRFHPKPFMEHGPGRPYLQLYEQQSKKKRRLLKVRFVLYNWTATCQPVSVGGMECRA